MKNIYRYRNITVFSAILFILFVAVSCNKSDLLDAKPKSNLAIPSNLRDAQALLESGYNYMPATDALADNYYLSNTYLQTVNPQSLNIYNFASDIYQGTGNVADWNTPYNQVFTANVVLETLPSIAVTTTNQAQWNNLKGWALFVRAFSFYNLAQLYAPLYDSTTANNMQGIPLRLNSNLNEKTVRSSLAQTYDRIFQDLSEARNLLDNGVPLMNKNRPSLIATFGLYSRLYLSIGNYVKAGVYADSALKIYNTLVNYNSITTSTSKYFPFTNLNNAEVFFSAQQLSANGPTGTILNTVGNNIQAGIDSSLYKSYDVNDLRKNVFYYIKTGIVNLNWGYDATGYVFGGFGTDEMYLNRAEALARSGNTVSAMADLNTLLMNRWKTGTFVPLTAATSAIALTTILNERRKELAFRGVRFSDLRRLNKEGYNITITHIVNGQSVVLLPNDPKYVFPIPPDVIQLTGISQNPR